MSNTAKLASLLTKALHDLAKDEFENGGFYDFDVYEVTQTTDANTFSVCIAEPGTKGVYLTVTIK